MSVPVDVKPIDQWWQVHPQVENWPGHRPDGRLPDCPKATAGVDQVYNLAADMGGMSFIENNKAACMLSVLISTHLLQAAVENDVERLFDASSACVYAAEHEDEPQRDRPQGRQTPTRRMPEDGYGWEKLFSERMARHFREDYGIQTRMARDHNVYGPNGSWTGGREKAPAALCRKVAECVVGGHREIGVWGDGEQTRSFMFVDDCVTRHPDAHRLRRHRTDQHRFVRTRLDQRPHRHHQRYRRHHGRAGSRSQRRRRVSVGRNSDNTMILDKLGWEPSTSSCAPASR